MDQIQHCWPGSQMKSNCTDWLHVGGKNEEAGGKVQLLWNICKKHTNALELMNHTQPHTHKRIINSKWHYFNSEWPLSVTDSEKVTSTNSQSGCETYKCHSSLLWWLPLMFRGRAPSCSTAKVRKHEGKVRAICSLAFCGRLTLTLVNSICVYSRHGRNHLTGVVMAPSFSNTDVLTCFVHRHVKLPSLVCGSLFVRNPLRVHREPDQTQERL